MPQNRACYRLLAVFASDRTSSICFDLFGDEIFGGPLEDGLQVVSSPPILATLEFLPQSIGRSEIWHVVRACEVQRRPVMP